MKFENTQVWGFEHAIRGMRNPLNSWEKSDSYYSNVPSDYEQQPCVIGQKDMALASRLIAGGSEHRKFLRQIFVSVDITAPLYWYKEFDTYKIGTTANSTSTMHTLATSPITINSFEIDDINYDIMDEFSIDHIVHICEQLRQKYVETKNKLYWKELVRWLPEGWLQKRTITMNYENLRTIYHQRKDHKLNEWSGKDNPNKENFIRWAESLPYAKEFIIN